MSQEACFYWGFETGVMIQPLRVEEFGWAIPRVALPRTDKKRSTFNSTLNIQFSEKPWVVSEQWRLPSPYGGRRR